jgi:hypothetical protein
MEVDFEVDMLENGHHRDSVPHSSPAKDKMDEDGVENEEVYAESNGRADDEEMLEEGIDWGAQVGPMSQFSVIEVDLCPFGANDSYDGWCSVIPPLSRLC